MNPMVEEYLLVKGQEKQDRQDAEMRKAEEAEARYRKRVLRRAGLLEEKIVEVDKSEYYSSEYSRVEKDEDGTKHYFMMKNAPIDVSDEEFAAIEKTFSEKELADMKSGLLPAQAGPAAEEKSAASSFFAGLGGAIIFIGFIIAIVAAMAVKESSDESAFMVFCTSFLTYLLAGCFCFCASELFKKLQTIVNLLRKQNGSAA